MPAVGYSIQHADFHSESISWAMLNFERRVKQYLLLRSQQVRGKNLAVRSLSKLVFDRKKHTADYVADLDRAIVLKSFKLILFWEIVVSAEI